MINNILEFSKMEKGKSNYQFVKSNLSETIKAALRLQLPTVRGAFKTYNLLTISELFLV
jgi:hypothetical protein